MNNNNVFLMIDESVEENESLIFKHNEVCKYKNIQTNDELLISKNVNTSTEESEGFILNFIENLLFKHFHTCIIYGSKNAQQSSLCNCLLTELVKNLLNQLHIVDNEPCMKKFIHEFNCINNRSNLFLSCIGVQNNSFYDLFDTNCAKYDRYCPDDFKAINICSTTNVESVLDEAKTINLDSSFNPEYSQIFINTLYFYSHLTKKSNRINFVEINDLNKFTNEIKDNEVVLSQNQLLAKVDLDIKNVLYNFITSKYDKFLTSIIRLNSRKDISQSDHVLRLVAELTNTNFSFTNFVKMPTDTERLAVYLLKQREKKIEMMKKLHAKNITEIKKETRQDVVEKLSNVHNDVIKKQKDSFHHLLEDTRKLNELKLDIMQRFYDEKIQEMKDRYEKKNNDGQVKELKLTVNTVQEINSNLLKKKQNLEEQLHNYQTRLDDIQSLLLGIPIIEKGTNIETEDIKPIIGNNSDTQDKENDQPQIMNIEELEIDTDSIIITTIEDKKSVPLKECNINVKINKVQSPITIVKRAPDEEKKEDDKLPQSSLLEDLRTKLQNQENLLEGAIEQINQLKAQVKKEVEEKMQLEQKLQFNEYVLRETKRHNVESIQMLTAENHTLKTEMQSMKDRHNEQFQKYERMIQRSKEEINVHRREAVVIRHHFMAGKSHSPRIEKEIPSTTSEWVDNDSNSSIFASTPTSVTKRRLANNLPSPSSKQNNFEANFSSISNSDTSAKTTSIKAKAPGRKVGTPIGKIKDIDEIANPAEATKNLRRKAKCPVEEENAQISKTESVSSKFLRTPTTRSKTPKQESETSMNSWISVTCSSTTEVESHQKSSDSESCTTKSSRPKRGRKPRGGKKV